VRLGGFVSPIPVELLDLAAQRLLDSRALIDGFETSIQAQHFFLSLASAAAVGKSTKLAERLTFAVSAHCQQVKHRLPIEIAMVIGVSASAAQPSEQDADTWLGEYATRLAFGVRETDEAKRLLGVISTLCRVRPSLRAQLSKSIVAARAASWLDD
tara:strand:+ start:239247 stop:239714 length:468 start_codon:yes stop_codon:yes gene_type:complete